MITFCGVVDPTQLKGYQPIPENMPEWKKAMMKKKNDALIEEHMVSDMYFTFVCRLHLETAPNFRHVQKLLHINVKQCEFSKQYVHVDMFECSHREIN